MQLRLLLLVPQAQPWANCKYANYFRVKKLPLQWKRRQWAFVCLAGCLCCFWFGQPRSFWWATRTCNQWSMYVLSVLSLAGWAFNTSWSTAVYVCVCVCLHVNQGGRNHNHCTQKLCNLACTDLLMNPDQKPKTRSTWPT